MIDDDTIDQGSLSLPALLHSANGIVRSVLYCVPLTRCSVGLAGSAFKKVYCDPSFGRQVALYIAAEDLILPYGDSNIESPQSATNVLR